MAFWFIMLIAGEIIPFILYKFGKLYLTNPPEDRKSPLRCRAVNAGKSDETWHFAHRLCGELWYKAGFYLLMLVALVMILVIGQEAYKVKNTFFVILAFELFTIVRSIFVLHKRMHKEFDEEGNRLTADDEVEERNKDLYI